MQFYQSEFGHHLYSQRSISDTRADISPAQVDEISRLRQAAGAGPVPSACYPAADPSGNITLTHDELVGLIADAVRRIR